MHSLASKSFPNNIVSLKNENCYGADFANTGGTAGCHNGSTNDDEVGIVTIRVQ